jgi:hypothetical protein
MSSNYHLQTDLNEAKSMVAVLEDYVRGTELYGHASGGFFSNMPSLTVGAVVMRLRRLDNLRTSMKDSQIKELDKALDKWHEVRNEWRLHYEEKLKREAESRLDAMKTFFKECNDSMVNCKHNYRPELLRRTIVQEILRELEELRVDAEAVKRKVAESDAKLHSYMSDDEFQWSDGLQSIYPKTEFWWLYQRPNVDES